jgi:two-component system OmpR family sensor kinase
MSRRLPRRPLSSRQRITVQLVLALVAFWALAGFAIVRVVTSQLSNRIDDELAVEARTTATVSEIVDEDALDRLSSEIGVGGRESAIIIVGPDGPSFALPAGTADSPQPLPDISGVSVAQLRGRSGVAFTVDDVAGHANRYRVVTVPLPSGDVVVVARSLLGLQQLDDLLRTIVTIGLIATVGVVCLLVWVISRTAMKPLEDVIGTAHAIGAGTLDTRVEVDSTAPDVERLADALNTMLGRLQQAFAAKELSEARLRQFVADASHELRTPLAAVIGYAELYQHNIARSPDQVETAMRRIVAEGTRMRALVEDLLLLARLDEGRPLARDAVEVVDLVADAVASIRTVAPDRTFTVRPPAGGRPAVLGDHIALRQVVDNLLANTVAHTPPETITVIEVTADHDHAVITVSDDGPGIAEDDIGHAFDRFWRAEKSRARPGGNGLGLAIVADLVHAHGGQVTMVSTIGRGTSVRVTLPLVERSSAPGGAAVTSVATVTT